MLPLYKFFALLVKVLTKPLLNMVKKRHKSRTDLSSHYLSRLFIWAGNIEYKFDLFLNRKLMSVSTDKDMFVKSLNPDIALEKGIEVSYEVFFYMLIISVTVYELRKATIESRTKSEKDARERLQLEKRLVQLEIENRDIVKLVTETRKEIEVMSFYLRNETCAKKDFEDFRANLKKDK